MRALLLTAAAARDLGDRVRAEDGCGTAVARLERLTAGVREAVPA